MGGEIPEDLKPVVEEILAERIKEHNAEAWARGINGSLTKHSEAIDELRVQVGRLAASIEHMSETQSDRAVATAVKLGIPMLSPDRKQTLSEMIDREEEDRLIKKRADKREGLLHNRLVQAGIGIAILYQALGITAALYNAFTGAAHPLRLWP